MVSESNQNDYSLTAVIINGMEYLTSKELLAKHEIVIAFTGRGGGFSEEPYSSLNLAFHVGDNPEHVVKNRKKIFGGLGLDLGRAVCAEQVHGTEVALVTELNAGCGAMSLETCIKGADALVTDEPNISLGLFFADCVPIIIVEPKKRIIGVAHAGWRGIFGNIVNRVIERMNEAHSIASSDLLAFVGPSIGGCCYQVGADLIESFAGRFKNTDDWLVGERIDLRNIANRQLLGSGINRNSIYMSSQICTSCDSDRFFSYRADGGRTGRHAAIAAII